MTWINADGSEMQQANWDDPQCACFGMLLDGRAQVTGIRQRGEDATLLMVLNALARRAWTSPCPRRPAASAGAG